MISIVIPTHDISERGEYLGRLLMSIDHQTYRDFEIVLTATKLGCGVNLNTGLKQARGDIVKIMCMDDSFAYNNALFDIQHHFDAFPLKYWMMVSQSTCPHPALNPRLPYGHNTLGPLSGLTLRRPPNGEFHLFDPTLRWLIDVDYYTRMTFRYGKPLVLDDKVVVNVGIHPNQETHKIPDELKTAEHNRMRQAWPEIHEV